MLKLILSLLGLIAVIIPLINCIKSIGSMEGTGSAEGIFSAFGNLLGIPFFGIIALVLLIYVFIQLEEISNRNKTKKGPSTSSRNNKPMSPQEAKRIADEVMKEIERRGL